MPQCSAFGCMNRTGGKTNIPSDVSWYAFPRDPCLLRKWLHNVRRQTFKPTLTSRLCSAHFLPSCFKEDAYEKYGIQTEGTQRKRPLKDDAVPTEFIYRKSKDVTVTRGSSVSQMEKRKRHPLKLLPVSKSQEMREMQGEPSTVQTELVHPPQSKIIKKSQKVSSAVDAEMLDEVIEETEDLKSPSCCPAPRMQIQIPAQSVPALVHGTPRRIKKDHCYASEPIPTTRSWFTQTDRPEEPQAEPQSSSPFHSSPLYPMEPEENLSEYLPSSSDTCSSSDDESHNPHDRCKMRKYIVFEDNLTELVRFCKECGSPVAESKKFTRGSMVGFNVTCLHGHSYVWQSQPLDRQQPVGNLLIAAAIIISGNTYAKICAFAELLNLQLFSKSVYNKIQRNWIIPVIQACWNKERNKAVEEVKLLGDVVLGGDGRCDSPGHSAKYGSYTLMNTDGDGKAGTRKIVSLQLVQVSEVKNSNHMEPVGLQRCLSELADDGLTPAVLATDRHVMVTSIMKTDYKEINHQFDTWHLSKAIVKKLSAKAKQKDCIELTPWIQSVSNHIWWSCSSCGEDDQVLREKWLSLLHHVTNQHEWCGNQKFHKCGHPPLPKEDRREIEWLKPESAAFKALKAVVTDKLLLKALPHLTKFCHTGELEIFHGMLLKYCPKRQHFHYDAMYARLMLAALDWNGSRRVQLTDKFGKPATSVAYSKRRKVYILKNRYGKIKSDHMFHIMENIYQAHHDNIHLPGIDRPAEISQGISRVEKPGKSELNKSFMSRFVTN